MQGSPGLQGTTSSGDLSFRLQPSISRSHVQHTDITVVTKLVRIRMAKLPRVICQCDRLLGEKLEKVIISRSRPPHLSALPPSLYVLLVLALGTHTEALWKGQKAILADRVKLCVDRSSFSHVIHVLMFAAQLLVSSIGKEGEDRAIEEDTPSASGGVRSTGGGGQRGGERRWNGMMKARAGKETFGYSEQGKREGSACTSLSLSKVFRN